MSFSLSSIVYMYCDTVIVSDKTNIGLRVYSQSMYTEQVYFSSKYYLILTTIFLLYVLFDFIQVSYVIVLDTEIQGL